MSASKSAPASAGAPAQQTVRRVGDYLLGPTLGEGTFGKVKLATHSRTGEKVAMKVLDKEKIMQKRMQEQILREISITKTLKHRNIVVLREVLHSKRNIYIVLELCTGGELFDKIVGSRHFDENKARDYFRQLIEGLAYCHAKNVAHRDLKPENLLLASDDTLKISDFGLSAVMNQQYALQTPCGTPNYVAPEVLSHKGYEGRHADVWSAGVVLYVMLAGALPFDEKTDAQLFEKIKRGQYHSFPAWFSSGVKDLLRRIFVVDPNKRISLDAIMHDPWFLAGGYQPQSYSHEVDAASQASEALKDEVTVQEEKIDVQAELSVKSSSMNGPANLDVFSLISMLDSANLGRIFGYRGGDTIFRQTSFLLPRGAEQAFDIAQQVCKEMRLTIAPNRSAFKIRCLSPRTVFGVQIYILIDNFCVVTVNRRKGDTLEFHKVYNDFSDACSKRAGLAGVQRNAPQ